MSVCNLVSDEDRKLPSPFTQPPTASLLIERERQAKERALPPGSSKLGRLRGHSEPAADKVHAVCLLVIPLRSMDYKTHEKKLDCSVLSIR